ncbi:hypothetical protein NM688_g2296 [Phlebia brevispora]|uniref:Uncharacterized protein n=1 Tax=Phlebia brevispora TaxID=194682 RepID=A0ACC1T9A7_9APHY|nr:hypothetical protein NM688_g2296 [Phlebia brevispora]
MQCDPHHDNDKMKGLPLIKVLSTHRISSHISAVMRKPAAARSAVLQGHHTSSKVAQCNICGVEWNAKGLASHRCACLKRQEEVNQDFRMRQMETGQVLGGAGNILSPGSAFCNVVYLYPHVMFTFAAVSSQRKVYTILRQHLEDHPTSSFLFHRLAVSPTIFSSRRMHVSSPKEDQCVLTAPRLKARTSAASARSWLAAVVVFLDVRILTALHGFDACYRCGTTTLHQASCGTNSISSCIHTIFCLKYQFRNLHLGVLVVCSFHLVSCIHALCTKMLLLSLFTHIAPELARECLTQRYNMPYDMPLSVWQPNCPSQWRCLSRDYPSAVGELPSLPKDLRAVVTASSVLDLYSEALCSGCILSVELEYHDPGCSVHGLEICDGDSGQEPDSAGYACDAEAQNLPASDVPVEIANMSTLLEDDDIMTIYHPASGLSAKIEHFGDYGADEDAIRDHVSDFHLTAKFGSQVEFEFAELILDAGLNHKETDRLLKIVHKIRAGAPFSFKTHTDIESAWDTAGRWHASFQKTTLALPYKDREYQFTVQHRNLWQYALDIIADPNFVKYMKWNARQLFKFDATTQRFKLFVHEPWTGTLWWKIQCLLPFGAKPVCFIVYSDKTHLSSLGSETGYPVMARILNLDVDIRNGYGPAGGQVIGWLPKIEEEETEKGKPAFINLKRGMWHACYRKILELLLSAAKTGHMWKCGDNKERWLFPVILLLTADYEEQTTMLLTRGNNGLFPCPVCLIPHDKQHNLDLFWPRRNTEEAKAIVQNYNLSSTVKNQLLKNLGLRDVENVFWEFPRMNPHESVCFDRLHFNHIDLFGDHLWGVLNDLLEDGDRSMCAAVDRQASLLPRWRNLNHFSKISVIFAAHHVVTEEACPLGFLLLCCIRAYLEHDMYLAMEVHTEETIALGCAALSEFGALIDILSQRYPDKKWDFIKLHWQTHSYDEIWAKGATRNYNTKPFEKLHGEFKTTYRERTNYKQVDNQILHVNHQLVTAHSIRANLDIFERYCKEIAEEDTNTDTNNTKPLPFPQHFESKHVYIGSGSRPMSFERVQAEHLNDVAFARLCLRFARYLTEFMPKPNGEQWRIGPECKLQFFKFLKVKFESKVTWRQEMDYLHCNPCFYGQPRYDGVLIKLDEANVLFGKLVFIFTCQLGEDKHAFALIQPLDMPTGELLQKDRQLHLYRLHAHARQHSIFIPIEFIIRGALVAEDPLTPDDFFVMDIVDTDWFLHCRNIFSHRIVW